MYVLGKLKKEKKSYKKDMSKSFPCESDAGETV